MKKSTNFDIPVVILCGGKGTRLGHLTEKLPKPLVEIGNKPILWHVMKIYAEQGCKEFILCLGYKKEKIKRYFKDHNHEGWKIHFIDTGLESTKSERLQRIRRLIKTPDFFLAYGDDVADINLKALYKTHQRSQCLVTITVVKMVSDFGLVDLDRRHRIIGFKEKPVLDIWMNGGFMAMSTKIFDHLNVGELEQEVFERLVRLKQIGAYKHHGQWKTMNTLKDNLELNKLWGSKRAFWKTWEGV